MHTEGGHAAKNGFQQQANVGGTSLACLRAQKAPSAHALMGANETARTLVLGRRYLLPQLQQLRIHRRLLRLIHRLLPLPRRRLHRTWEGQRTLTSRAERATRGRGQGAAGTAHPDAGCCWYRQMTGTLA